MDSTPSVSNNVVYIPLKAAAGFADGQNNPITNKELQLFHIPVLKYLAYCFQIQGNSMQPTLNDDEYVFTEQTPVRRIEDIQNGKIHVVELIDGSYIVKRVSQTNEDGVIMIESDNQDHHDPQERFHYGTEFSRLWKVKNALKWHLGNDPNFNDLDTSIEDAAIKLDKKG